MAVRAERSPRQALAHRGSPLLLDHRSQEMILLLVGGLASLIVGAQALVRGASAAGSALGIPSLVIGLTVVAFGTSAPEMAVSVASGLSGRADLAVGNVIGSNIFNTLFILGVAALVAPLVVSSQLVRWDVPICIGVSAGALLLAASGAVSRGEGALLLVLLVAYMAFLVVQSVRASPDPASNGARPNGAGFSGGAHRRDHRFSRAYRWAKTLGLVIGGLTLLVLGTQWFVDGATTAARRLGVGELTIGLTVVAGGTSLPELATSVLAAARGERDLAVGNVVGSNIFNLVAVLGVTAAVSPRGVPVSSAALWLDFPVMIAVAVACLPIFFTGSRISRWEGALFLGYYGAYAAYLVLSATDHAALSAFSWTMAAFVIPITVVTLGVLGARSWRRDGGQGESPEEGRFS